MCSLNHGQRLHPQWTYQYSPLFYNAEQLKRREKNGSGDRHFLIMKHAEHKELLFLFLTRDGKLNAGKLTKECEDFCFEIVANSHGESFSENTKIYSLCFDPATQSDVLLCFDIENQSPFFLSLEQQNQKHLRFKKIPLDLSQIPEESKEKIEDYFQCNLDEESTPTAPQLFLGNSTSDIGISAQFFRPSDCHENEHTLNFMMTFAGDRYVATDCSVKKLFLENEKRLPFNIFARQSRDPEDDREIFIAITAVWGIGLILTAYRYLRQSTVTTLSHQPYDGEKVDISSSRAGNPTEAMPLPLGTDPQIIIKTIISQLGGLIEIFLHPIPEFQSVAYLVRESLLCKIAQPDCYLHFAQLPKEPHEKHKEVTEKLAHFFENDSILQIPNETFCDESPENLVRDICDRNTLNLNILRIEPQRPPTPILAEVFEYTSRQTLIMKTGFTPKKVFLFSMVNGYLKNLFEAVEIYGATKLSEQMDISDTENFNQLRVSLKQSFISKLKNHIHAITMTKFSELMTAHLTQEERERLSQACLQQIEEFGRVVIE